MKKPIKISFLALLALIIISSCSEDKNNLLNPEQNLPIVWGPPTNTTTFSDIYDAYMATIDTTKIVGECQIRSENQSVTSLDWNTSESHRNTASIFLWDSTFAPGIPLGTCHINSTELVRYASDPTAYLYRAKGDESNNSEMLLNFGAANSFVIQANSFYSGVDTIITFFAQSTINNLANGDTVSKSSPLFLSWVGAYYTCVAIESIDIIASGGQYVGTCFFENTNSYSFPASQLQNFPNGLYDLSVSGFKPYSLIDSNGNIISTLVESTRKITIELVD